MDTPALREIMGGRSPQEAYDRFGRLVQAGDCVMLTQPSQIIWRVAGTRPVMDPRVPPNTVEIQLVASFVTGVQGGLNIQDMVKVLSAAEQAIVGAQLPANDEGKPGAADPTPDGTPQ